jgi:hypothetical protein
VDGISGQGPPLASLPLDPWPPDPIPSLGGEVCVGEAPLPLSSSTSSSTAKAGALEGVAHVESLAWSAARADRLEDGLETFMALLDTCSVARDVPDACTAAPDGAARKCAW